MEPISAFAAYQSQNNATKKAAKNKSPKAKKAKKPHVQQAAPTEKAQKKKRKLTEGSETQAPASTSKEAKTSNVTSSVTIVNGTTTSPNPPKLKKMSQNQATVKQQFHQSGAATASPSSSNSDMNLSSVARGEKAFAHILYAPNDMDVKKFMKEHWETKPLHIGRGNRKHYADLKVSTKSIDEMLRNNVIEYTKNLDITSYENNQRETHNPDGRAMPGFVWDSYRNGCSVRLINPQTFIGPLHNFCATLQEYFHCLVGANIYLTPPNSQGFAPHYDDIEAFVLQVEGKKEWHLYPPRTDNEKLPRESSGNFHPDEIGAPSASIILSPGDMLYFPRGWIHQAKTVPDCHSLHITVSVYQKNSYAELFEELTKQALQKAIEENIEFRRGVPMGLWNHFGESYSNCHSNVDRNKMKTVFTNMFKNLVNYVDIDAAVDKMAIKYQHDALPPVLTAAEKARTTFGTAPLVKPNGKIEMLEMTEDTEIRLLRAHIVRLVKNDDEVYHLYYYADNSKEYHGSDLNYVEVDGATVGVIKKLIQEYPKYIQLRGLAPNIEDVETVVLDLWDRGLLMTKEPLEQTPE